MDTIIASIIARLTDDTLRARIIAQPTQSNVITLAEEGYHCFVASPHPIATSGAGRWGYKTVRDVGVIVVSPPVMRDPGGREDNAVKQHLANEIKCVDAVLDFKTEPKASGAIMIRWTPGGDEMTRWIKLNPGMFASGLNFTVTYVPTLTKPV